MTELTEPPAHKYGYSEDQVEKILGDKADSFWEWMRGQTMMLDADLGLVVYTHDLRRFMNGLPIID